jgi:colanic acid/amylovoran biosynthesis glycosyltransferase
MKKLSTERKFLYLVVAEFPYGHGEIFLRDEIAFLSQAFERVYLVIPDDTKIKPGSYKASLPENVSICALKSKAGILDRIYTLPKAWNEFHGLERKSVIDKLRTESKSNLFRILWGYLALSNSFKHQFIRLLASHRHQPNQVTFYSYWFFYPTIALAEIKEKNPHYRAISRMHGWDCFFERSPHNYLPLRPYSINKLDLLASISETGMRYTQTKLEGYINSRKLAFSRLGITSSQMGLTKKDESETFLLITLAYISPVKRLNRIAEALLKWKGKRIKWEHIGVAQDKNRGFEDSVNAQFKDHPSVSVSFKGELQQKEIFEFFIEERPDLLICTSESEGIPVSMMEAMAHGIPVLSVDVGGVHEIVEHSKNGLLIPAAATENEIRLALEEYIGFSPETKNAMRQNAVKTYEDKFNAQKNYTTFAQTVLKGQ